MDAQGCRDGDWGCWQHNRAHGAHAQGRTPWHVRVLPAVFADPGGCGEDGTPRVPRFLPTRGAAGSDLRRTVLGWHRKEQGSGAPVVAAVSEPPRSHLGGLDLSSPTSLLRHRWRGTHRMVRASSPGAASVSPADRQDERCPIPPPRAAAWDEVFENGARVWLLRNARSPVSGETKEAQNQGSPGQEGCVPGAAEVRRDAGRSTPRCWEQPSPRPVLVACCRWGLAPGSVLQRRVGSFPSAQQLLKGQGTMLPCGSPGICFVEGVKSSSEPRLL